MKMVADLFRLANTLFTALCILVAICFTVYCTYQYCKNEDMSVVTFSEYHDGEDNIYPGMTLCFRQYHEKGSFSEGKQGKKEKFIYHKELLEGHPLFETVEQKMSYLKSTVEKEGETSPKHSSGMAQNQKANETIEQKNNTVPSLSNSQSSARKNGQRANRKRNKRQISRNLTAEQEEIIQNVTQKLETLYKNNTALDIKDYLLFGLIRTSSTGLYVHEFNRDRSWILDNWGDRLDQQKNKTWKPLFYPSLSDIYKRCWTFEIPYNKNDQVHTFGVMLNKSIFGNNGTHFKRRPAYKDFEIRFSYPKQHLTAATTKSNWGFLDSPRKEYTMNFEIQNMVVLKRRNKPNKECRNIWKDNDKKIVENVVATSGCFLPHWSLNTTVPICIGRKLQNITRLLGNLKGHPEPCQSIEKFMYLYQEHVGLDFKEQTLDEAVKFNGTNYAREHMFGIVVNFQGATYMEITQSRAYDAQSLVGNAGGYVGLFLGVALIQTPAALCRVARLLKKCFS